MGLFKNASPANIALGANDKGSRALPITRDPLPQHVPLIFTFAQKGTTQKTFTSGAAAMLNYGAETFNQDSKFYTHTTQLMSDMFAAGNACSVQRVVPTDAGPASSLVLYVDILPTTVPNYVRDSKGNKVIDTTTNAFMVDTTTPTINGHRIKFITEQVPTNSAPGTLTPKPGTMTIGGVTSTMHPILEHHAAFQGEYYNNIGYAIESILDGSIDTAAMIANKAMLYNLYLVTRPTAGSSSVILRTLAGEPSRQFTLKPGTKHPVTQLKLDLNTVQDTNWFNETDPLLPTRYNDYSSLHVYTSELDTVLTAIATLEAPYITTASQTWHDGLTANTQGWFDFSATTTNGIIAEKDLLNLFAAKSSKNVDYFTLIIEGTAPTLTAGQKEVHISKTTPVFLEGGSDGTTDLAMLDTVVTAEMVKYLDPNSHVIDNAINVETHLYDSGFGFNTKLELFNFISVRKDTVVAVGTHTFAPGSTVAALTDTRATASLLKTRAGLFPESGFFGTPVSRAVVMGGGYKLYGVADNEYYPFTFELAIKSARMMSAGNYKWKANMNFDHGPEAVLSYGRAYEPSFIPAGIKPSLWADGMVWAQPKDLHTYFVPAVQTVYSNDTSPLNNWYTICALATLNRIASDTWREFTGTSTMSDIEFKDVVLNYLNNRIQGIFDGLMVAIPEVIISPEDAIRGYSWQVMFKLYSGNMKTKMVSYTEVYRLNDIAVA